MDTDRVATGPAWLVAGRIAISDDGAQARFDGGRLPLTHAQRLVLLALVRQGGRTARRSEIYDLAFGRPLGSGSRAIDTHVARIRRVLGPSGRCIVTVGRVGYRLDLDVLEAQNGTPA